MKLFRAFLFVSLLCFTQLSQAGNFGLGIILLSPTGLSVNNYLDRKHSIDGAFSTSLNDDDQDFYFHATYLWHSPHVLKIDKSFLDAHYGIGARVIAWDEPRPKNGKDYKHDPYIGPRGVVGSSVYFKKSRLQVFGELSLTVDIMPESESDIDFGLGLRYYFK